MVTSNISVMKLVDRTA